jgi:hypothetical protein
MKMGIKLLVALTHTPLSIIPGMPELAAKGLEGVALGVAAGESLPPLNHFISKPRTFLERALDFGKKHWKGILLSVLLISSVVALPYIIAPIAGVALTTAIIYAGYATFGLGVASLLKAAWSAVSLWGEERKKIDEINVRLTHTGERLETLLSNSKHYHEEEKLESSSKPEHPHESVTDISSRLQHASNIQSIKDIINKEILKQHKNDLTDSQRERILAQIKEVDTVNAKITPEDFRQNIVNILNERYNRDIFKEIIQKLQGLDKSQSQVLLESIAASPTTIQTPHSNESEKPSVKVNEDAAKNVSSSQTPHH